MRPHDDRADEDPEAGEEPEQPREDASIRRAHPRLAPLPARGRRLLVLRARVLLAHARNLPTASARRSIERSFIGSSHTMTSAKPASRERVEARGHGLGVAHDVLRAVAGRSRQVGVVVADRDPGRARDRRRVAPDRLGRPVELGHARGEDLVVRARDPGAVPEVGMPRGDARHAAHPRGDEERDAARSAAAAARRPRPATQRPWYVTRSPSRSAWRTWRDSSVRPSRWSVGTPNATYSGSCQPALTPSVRRPPIASSSVTAIFASSAGLRKRMPSTRLPIPIRFVASPSSAMIVHGSSAPRSAWPGIRNSTWSKAQSASKPASSARCAKLRMNGYGSGVLEWLPMGRTRPIFNERSLRRCRDRWYGTALP